MKNVEVKEKDIVKFKNTHLDLNIPQVPKTASRLKKSRNPEIQKAKSTQSGVKRHKDFVDFLYEENKKIKNVDIYEGYKTRVVSKLPKTDLAGVMKFEGQINIKGQGKFIYDKQKSLLELLKQVSNGKGGDEFFPNTPFGLNNNQFPEHTQKEIDEYRAKLASKQEDFLSKNPHLFSDLGVLTTKEIQESLDAMKDAIGNSVNLKNEEMNYNYSNQFESVKDLLSPTQAGVNQCEILNNPN